MLLTKKYPLPITPWNRPREGDPLLHTHLVANRVQEPDGRWTALDGRDLYRHRLAADAIYRASYQRQLSRTLGVEWTAADAYGNRELEGLPEDLVRLDSKRTDRIDLEVERLEASGRERTPSHASEAPNPCGGGRGPATRRMLGVPWQRQPRHGSRVAAALASLARKGRLADRAGGDGW